MMSGLIPVPKTRAGQYLRRDDNKVIRERLTSYGSQAYVIVDMDIIIVYWDKREKLHMTTNCGLNTTFAYALWSEIV